MSRNTIDLLITRNLIYAQKIIDFLHNDQVRKKYGINSMA